MSGVLRYKESKGTVCRTKGRTIWVALIPECVTTRQCNAGCIGCNGKKEQGKIISAIDDPARFTLGQAVILHYYELNELYGALIVFGIPLVCALLSLFIWYTVSPATVESGPSLLVSGIAFCTGFFIVKLIDRRIRGAFPSKITADEDMIVYPTHTTTENRSNG